MAGSDSLSSVASNPSESTQDWPLDKDNDDTLIPSLTDVYRAFFDGKATWEMFLDKANKIPSGLWPADALSPYTTLAKVPGLPERLPRRDVLYGRPCWELPLDIGGPSFEEGDANRSVSLVHGHRVIFSLSNERLIRSNICPDAASFALGVGSTTTNSLAVLVMCWSYILSVRLLEMQGRRVQYSMDRLWPSTSQCQHGHVINLKGASSSLIRWLCAILSPKIGWKVRDTGGLPPWTTCFATEVKICIEAATPAVEIRSPPNSSEATELLIELCQLFNLKTDTTDIAPGLEPMQPYKASFLATLMLPFYDFMRLVPCLPPPHLTRQRNSTFDNADEQSIRGYFDDMRYFMTLSLSPLSIGSILWSIFWQPGINCNLVSPWLASVLDTLDPLLQNQQVEVLVKVFLSRRPRIAVWWVALFMLGDLAIVDWIRRYTVTIEEKYGFGSLSPPHPMVSAWTGCKQSFLDIEKETIYAEPDDWVSREDLLRCRFDQKLQDSASSNLSWRPFGYMQKKHVEIEIWPQLETRYSRKYHSFTWYANKNQPVSDKGFRVCTGRTVADVPDNLEIVTSPAGCWKRSGHALNVQPSKKSTLKMMHFLVENAIGNRDWAIADVQDREQFSWLRDWEGLYFWDTPLVHVENLVIAPSWFLEEWIRDRYQ